jgi:hypothetical protein
VSGQYERLDGIDDGPLTHIGHGVTIRWVQWREHNPAGVIEEHDRPDGAGRCVSSVLFDLPGIREAFPGRHVWQVPSLNPLTLTPSLLCTACGHHGYIRNGRWVPA